MKTMASQTITYNKNKFCDAIVFLLFIKDEFTLGLAPAFFVRVRHPGLLSILTKNDGTTQVHGEGVSGGDDKPDKHPG